MKLRLLLATAILAVLAVPAFAADHQFELSAAKAVTEWEGAADISRGLPVYDEAARTAIPCDSGPARPCEEVLLKVTEPGKFTATVEGLEGTGGTTDVDAYLYKSDESGAAGEQIATGVANGADTVTAAKAAPGFYLLVVDYYHSYNSGYKGKIKFTSTAPPAAPVAVPPVIAPVAPAAEAPKPAAKKKKPTCAQKAKKLKNAKKRAKALKACKKKSRKR